MTIVLSSAWFGIQDLVAVARHKDGIVLSEESIRAMRASRRVIDTLLAKHEAGYGITTGVGDNSRIAIDPAESAALQKNLIRSHSSGVGDPLAEEHVRAVMTMMVKNLSLGFSGVRVELIDLLVEMLNRNVVPAVPRQGSLGYLSYQAHISLVIIGEGEAFYDGDLRPGREALRGAGLSPLELEAKEGLSLLNGTADMVALGALAACDARSLAKCADIGGAVSFEALLGNDSALDQRIATAKLHAGVGTTAHNLRRLVAESELLSQYGARRVQDALSVRSMPQVHGAAKDFIAFTSSIVENEMNSATDNPLIVSDAGESVSSSNCHGESAAMALDTLVIALSELASISERRTFRLTSSQYSDLSPFLSESPGTGSGYMIPQYVAASLVSDNKRLAQPASVDSIPSAAGQEDHVSMGTSSALKALDVVANVEQVLAIELLCSCQALEFAPVRGFGRGVEAVYGTVRHVVPKLEGDRAPYKDIGSIRDILRTGSLKAAVEDAVGEISV